jgi:hypothetical protein
MHHDMELNDDDARELFAALPCSVPLDPGETDRMVDRLRAEGLLSSPVRPRRYRAFALPAAAAIVIFAVGAWAGARYSRQASLEHQVSRQDLSVAERVLLLQRADSVYVKAAQDYSAATAPVVAVSNRKQIIWF